MREGSQYRQPAVASGTGGLGPVPVNEGTSRTVTFRKTSRKTLTRKQREILDVLTFLNRKGEFPSVRELGSHVNLSSTATVHKHLKALERGEYVESLGHARGYRVVKGIGIPLVGSIAAGEPLENLEAPHSDPDDEMHGFRRFPEISIDPNLFHPGAAPEELVALRIEGESMVDAGIFDGDIVVIRCQPTVEEGEIAAVTVDGEGTLKRWSRRNSDWCNSDRCNSDRSGARRTTVRLSPANDRFEPICIDEDAGKSVRVLGKYIGLIRGENVGMG